MPYKYGQITSPKKERITETVNVSNIGLGNERKKGSSEWEYLKVVLDKKVSKTIKGEKKDVADAISTFADSQGEYINWDKDVPAVIKKIDDMTQKGTVTVKVKAVYYLGTNDEKRAKLSDLAKWEIL